MSGDILPFSLLETLAYAIESSHSHNTDYLDSVRRGVAALVGPLALSADEAATLHTAALLHNIGRLSVPEHILHKTAPLTDAEETKLRAHSLQAERLLSSVAFPGPVAQIVRHHTEHWDGTGSPDGLRQTEIPLGARLLAVAAAYSALRHRRAFRATLLPADALAILETQSGGLFDPLLVGLFAEVVDCIEGMAPLPGFASSFTTETREALASIGGARRETFGLFTLAQATASSLHLEAVADAILSHTRAIAPHATCVLFLPEEDGEFLRAVSAIGANARHLLGSLARIGTYLTGRAFTREEIVQTSFLAHDLILRDVSDPWVPFRSTLILPLKAGGQAIGTLNLYAEEPNAFDPDMLRILRMIATMAGRALDNARCFAAVQETAYTDALTGLRNARYLREFLEREVNRAQRENTPLAVLNIDLDNFKPINDEFGHARGDQTLREVAEILTDHIRSYDLAARYAGDEFVVVLSRTGRVPAETVANKLKLAVEQHSRELTAREPGFPRLGISIGVALFPDDAPDLQGLLCRSDAAMYTDKQSRRAGREATGDGRQAA